MVADWEVGVVWLDCIGGATEEGALKQGKLA